VSYPPALQAVVDELGRFPGVGPKSAQRIAFWLMRQPSEDVDRLANSLGEMKSSCRSANGAATSPSPGDSVPSVATRDGTRQRSAWWKVPPTCGGRALGGFSRDVSRAARRAQSTRGGHARSTEDPRADPTSSRSGEGGHSLFQLERRGGSHAMYLSRLLQVPGLIVSQPASGLPVGGDLEFADDLTLGRAIDGRRILAD
jgi:recombination protein RecR